VTTALRLLKNTAVFSTTSLPSIANTSVDRYWGPHQPGGPLPSHPVTIIGLCTVCRLIRWAVPRFSHFGEHIGLK
jgi:hypothetical protein